MKIESMRIQNLRSIKDQTIPFNNYTCLVGPNGSGKSTVLLALNIFFRESEGYCNDLTQLGVEDFHQKNTDDPIAITVIFSDLSPEAQKDFADYYRQGKLVISSVAKYDQTTEKAELKQYGQRLAMDVFSSYFKALGDGEKVSELKKKYEELRKDFCDLPSPGTKDAMTNALRQYEASHPDQCTLIQSEDQFYGWSKGANILAKYVQWIHVPAVKDVTAEQIEGKNTALGKLLARTVRAKVSFSDDIRGLRQDAQEKYRKLLDDNQLVLEDISARLKTRLLDWSHPDAAIRLEWQQDPEKSIRIEEPLAHIIAGEAGFEGELSRFGHGFQRSYLLALLQELSASEGDEGPMLILSIEEPELYQHPPQARHLYTVLIKLSLSNSQVIICTHSPDFVSGEQFQDVRLLRKENHQSVVSYVTFDQISTEIARVTGNPSTRLAGVMAKIHQILQTSIGEMFFTPKLILVEGLEDIAYITTYMILMDKLDEFRRCGCHIVSAGKKSVLIQPMAIAKAMRIPTYLAFDSDGEKPDNNGSRTKHQKDNEALLKLCGIADPEPFPEDNFWGAGVTMWKSEIAKVVECDIGDTDWARYCQEADLAFGHVGGLRKNSLHIAKTLVLAWDEGKKSENLETLCMEILIFAQRDSQEGSVTPMG